MPTTDAANSIAAHDVDANRISVIGKGPAGPVHRDPKKDAEKAVDRRVVTVIQMRD